MKNLERSPVIFSTVAGVTLDDRIKVLYLDPVD
jgi:hypothetical protein